MRALLTVAIAGTFVFHVNARDCQLTDEQFTKQLATMKDWRRMYAVFKENLPTCPDDGFFAEGYDDVVATVLAKHWGDLPELKKLTARDSNFRDFVYRHISATANPTDLQLVLANARVACPTGCLQLCDGIAATAKRAVAGRQ
jgi:hypothetical protein